MCDCAVRIQIILEPMDELLDKLKRLIDNIIELIDQYIEKEAQQEKVDGVRAMQGAVARDAKKSGRQRKWGEMSEDEMSEGEMSEGEMSESETQGAGAGTGDGEDESEGEGGEKMEGVVEELEDGEGEGEGEAELKALRIAMEKFIMNQVDFEYVDKTITEIKEIISSVEKIISHIIKIIEKDSILKQIKDKFYTPTEQETLTSAFKPDEKSQLYSNIKAYEENYEAFDKITKLDKYLKQIMIPEKTSMLEVPSSPERVDGLYDELQSGGALSQKVNDTTLFMSEYNPTKKILMGGSPNVKANFDSFCRLFPFKDMRADIYHDFDFDIIQDALVGYMVDDTGDIIKLDTQMESFLMKSIVSKFDNDSLLKLDITFHCLYYL